MDAPEKRVAIHIKVKSLYLKGIKNSLSKYFKPSSLQNNLLFL
tara:strand:+ start:952 stop:1080 length:129 start_codon:yes stop_codon:yes gene_type:complete